MPKSTPDRPSNLAARLARLARFAFARPRSGRPFGPPANVEGPRSDPRHPEGPRPWAGRAAIRARPRRPIHPARESIR